MWTQRWMSIAWPAFMAAAVLEMLVFAAFDPDQMQWFGDALQMSRISIYSLAFFIFWALFLVSGYLTVLLSLPQEELNIKHEA